MSVEVQPVAVSHSTLEQVRRRSARTVQLLFAGLSLGMLLVGLVINWFAAEAGLSQEVVDCAAFGMLLAAVANATALWLWKE